MTKPRNIVGPVVRRLRHSMGLTQADLAAKLNLDGWDLARGTLAKIEAGIRWVADFELLALARALGVPPGALIDPADRPPSALVARRARPRSRPVASPRGR